MNYTNRDFILDLARWIRPYRWRFGASVFVRVIRDLTSLYPDVALVGIITILAQPLNKIDTHWLWFLVFSLGIAHLIRYTAQGVYRHLGFVVAERGGIGRTRTSHASSFAFRCHLA